MTERIQALRSLILNGEHHGSRTAAPSEAAELPYRNRALPYHRRSALRMKAMLEAQTPVFLPGERIALLRTTPDFPQVLSDDELNELKQTHYIHEQGRVCNLSPDYTSVIGRGLEAVIGDLSRTAALFPEKADYITSAVMSCRAVLELADRWRAAAEQAGLDEIAALLKQVPAHPARTFHEALQSFRVLHFALWCEGNYHNTVGRFDQYMFPYFDRDIREGRLTAGSALELIEEFFLTFNRDSDLYTGMQQGDNGQSMVLGGYDLDGRDRYNALSGLCMEAALEMRTIDPKINLRVSARTPLERYESASRLTAVGMGFPQYSNDDVVTKGLLRLGYAPCDAENYVVAACWEFIIPGKGMDIPNIGALCLPACVDHTLRANLQTNDYPAFLNALHETIAKETADLAAGFRSLFVLPSPYMSQFFEGRTALGEDIADGCVYNNYGIHGTGLANAADYLTVLKALVFDGPMSGGEFAAMLDADYEGYEAVRAQIARLPKFGSDEEGSNEAAAFLLSAFADACEGLVNERGGCFRAGTGSAMYYAFHAQTLGATGDGRHAGDYLPANYSPAIGADTGGPLNVIRAFASPELERVVNGGPLTLELSQRIVSLPEKLAPAVMAFVKLGGHQIQLNAVDREKLLDAEAHPDRYRELVVRVWGWSGYYTSLDEVYRRQIIRRTEYAM